MVRQFMWPRRRKILIDINTQRDFLFSEGKACIRNHRRILAHIRRMMAWARSRNVPVISTCQVNIINNNGGSEFDYCLDETEGQKKVSYTLLSRRVSFAADNSTDLPVDILRRYRQIVFHKRCIDPFAEPRIERLLTELKAEEFILIGAVAEEAVMATALGLLQRGKKVSVAVDAVGSRNNYEGKLAFRKMEAKGARLVETKKLAGISHLKQAGICHCNSCQEILKQKAVGATSRQAKSLYGRAGGSF